MKHFIIDREKLRKVIRKKLKRYGGLYTETELANMIGISQGLIQKMMYGNIKKHSDETERLLQSYLGEEFKDVCVFPSVEDSYLSEYVDILKNKPQIAEIVKNLDELNNNDLSLFSKYVEAKKVVKAVENDLSKSNNSSNNKTDNNSGDNRKKHVGI